MEERTGQGLGKGHGAFMPTEQPPSWHPPRADNRYSPTPLINITKDTFLPLFT